MRSITVEPTDADTTEAVTRRTIVPAKARGSLWFAAAWTGAGAAATGAVVGIVAVALCWLPASGTSGHTRSALKAGLLTFLAALHGGVSIDGAHIAFVPLGMTLLVAAVLYRAGTGLGDAAETLDERDPVRLALATGVQCAVFTAVCVALALGAGLGTSNAPPVGVGLAALVLSAAAGGLGVTRASELGDTLRRRRPPLLDEIGRSLLAAVACYLGIGALLVAGSIVIHRGQFVALTHQVGGGWSAVPVLLLGVLAAPNAVVAATSYLAGPGVAIGSGTHVGLIATPHGVLPAFPLLAAVPSHPAGPLTWLLAIATPLLAGWLAVRLLPDRGTWAELGRDFALIAAGTGLLCGLLGWQAGGGIGTGRLAAIGPSPWRLALATAGAVFVTQWAVMGAMAGREWLRAHRAATVAARASGTKPPEAAQVSETDGAVADALEYAASEPVEDSVDALPVSTAETAPVSTAETAPVTTAEPAESGVDDRPKASELAG